MLYVYDSNLKRIGMIGSFSYLLWRKRYSKHGEAELHVDASSKNIQLLQIGNVLFRSDDSEAMYIYYRGFKDDEEGRDILTIKCFSLVRWLDRRILWGIYNFNDTPENIIRSMINSECIAPNNPNRIIPQIKLTESKGFGTPIQLQASYDNLLQKIEDLCNTYEIGIRSMFDGRNLFYDVYEGTDRSINQTTNPRCILSKDFSNVITRDYEEADNDYKNTALIGGIGEGNARKFATIEQGAGLNRRELFVDDRNLQQKDEDDNPISDSDYILLLKQDGLEKLLENEIAISFDCELDVTKENTKYGRDFFLGDIITIRDDKLGIIMNSRVIEIDEVFQNSTKTINVTVGKSVPTLTEKIKKAVKK